MVGLTKIIYQNNWDSLGTHDPQYLYLILHGKQYRFPLPSGIYLYPAELETKFHSAMVQHVEDAIALQKDQTKTRAKRSPLEELDAIKNSSQEVEGPPSFPPFRGKKGKGS